MTIRMTPGGRYELRLTHKLLPKALYFTFDSDVAAAEYKAEALRYLSAGVVPAALINHKAPGMAKGERLLLVKIMHMWRNTGQPAKSDDQLLSWLSVDPFLKGVGTDGLTYAWVERWIEYLKVEKNYTPGSIRKRVNVVSKALDWFLRSHPESKFVNPLHLLPKGYSVYTKTDGDKARAAGGQSKVDTVRDRRLSVGEDERIRAALRGEKRPDRERALNLPDGDAMLHLFEVILHTGLRLREAYRLRREWIDLEGKTIRVQSSKQRHEKVVYREVPIRRELYPVLEALVKGKPAGLLFPFWDGDEETLDIISNRLKNRFVSVMAYAQCEGLTEHDLRHEATCRWLEERDSRGGWLFRLEEINKIMGWAPGSVMAARYASFRVESLASRLWS